MSSGQSNGKLPSLYIGKGAELDGVPVPKSGKAKGRVCDVAAKCGDAGKVIAPPSKPLVDIYLLHSLDIDLRKARALNSRFRRGLFEVIHLCEDSQFEPFLLLRLCVDDGVTHCFLLHKKAVHIYGFTLRGEYEENWVLFSDCPCLISNARELPFDSSHVHLKDVVKSVGPAATVSFLSNLLRPDVEGWKVCLKRLSNDLAIAANDVKFSRQKAPQPSSKGAKCKASKKVRSLTVKKCVLSHKPSVDLSKMPRIAFDMRNPRVLKETYVFGLNDIICQVSNKNMVCGVPLCSASDSEPCIILEFHVNNDIVHRFLLFKGDVGIYAFTVEGKDKWVSCCNCPYIIAGAEELPYDSSYQYRKLTSWFGPGAIEEGLSDLLCLDPSKWQSTLSCVGYNVTQAVRVLKWREYIFEKMDSRGRVKKIPNNILSYLEHWKDISNALTRWEQEKGVVLWGDVLGEVVLKATNLNSVDQAIDIMGVLM